MDVLSPQKIARLAFLLGFSSIIAQAVIMRAFQVVFYGNELSYAVLLASWLFWVGTGSLLASAVFAKAPCPFRFLVGAFCAAALGIPGLVFGIRYLKPLLDVAPGQLMGLVPMAISGVVLTAPVGFSIGMIFALLCRYARDWAREGAGAAGKVYFFEASGSAVGGMFFSFVLLKFLNTTLTAWAVSLTLLVVLWGNFRKEKAAAAILKGLVVFIAVFFAFDLFYGLNFLSHQKQWTFGQLIAVEDSPYANITVIERQGEVSFYENGILSFTSGDALSAEENVHLPLLAHPFPQRVLLIGKGLGGELEEILKHPGVQMDYVEIDHQLITLGRRYLPQERAAVLNHPGLTVHLADARQFVRMAEKNYDVVIINVGDPYTSGINRYYTLEFFAELDRILALGGVISFRVSSSGNYLNEENRMFLRSLNATLRAVFPRVASIPGDTHTFLVSNIADRVRIDPDWMVARLLASDIETRFVNEHTLPFLLDEWRMRSVEGILAEGDGLINRDLFPRAYLFSIFLWAAHFGAGLTWLLPYVHVPFWMIAAMLLSLICVVGFIKRRRGTAGCVDLAVTATGFSEIIFEIVVILAFQSLYGIAYDRIGFILAAFMIGLVAGSRQGVQILERKRTPAFTAFLWTQSAVVIYPLLLPFLFIVFRDAHIAQRWAGAASFVFAFLPFVAGWLGGLQYALAAALRCRSGNGETEAHSGGVLYALDAFGAAAGALVTGIFLIPVFGITAVCILCVMMNSVVWLFLYGSGRCQPAR